MWYNIDIYRLGYLLLPPVLRNGRLYAFLKVLLHPFFVLVTLFKNYRKSTLTTINTNGQVIYIEKALNDAFLFDDKLIYITDTGNDTYSASLLYPTEEGTMRVYEEGNEEVTYITASNEGKLNGDYQVNVPEFLNNEKDLETIKTILDYNKPAGRAYVIKIYDYE